MKILKNNMKNMSKIKLMMNLIFILSMCILFGFGVKAQAASICEASGTAHCYYIAPNGNDANPGTYEEPFASTNSIIDNLVPGNE